MRTLIENLEVAFTVNADDEILREASVVIEDDRIADIGSAVDINKRHARDGFDDILNGRRQGICPGFIDSHVHLSETLSRAVFPDNLNTRAWVFHWAKPFYAHITEEDEYIGSVLGAMEMLRGGTTCFLDMGSQYDPGIVVKAIEEIGMRGITGRHAADNPPSEMPRGWTDEMVKHHFFADSETALKELERCVLKYNNSANGRIRCWVNIEGKEPCSLELHIGARALAEKLGVGTTYHLATSVEEAKVCENKYGIWPITRIEQNDGLGDNLVIAHCVALSDDEVKLLAKYDTKVAFCPSSSLKLGKGATAIGKYPEMIDAGVTVGLGTDGVSAAGNLNLMRQMFIVAGLFKDGRLDSELVGARQALRMATIDGAKALMWEDEIGSLEIGKKADFILFDLNNIEWVPYHDPLQALVYSASSATISQTWVDGSVLYKDNKIQTMDENTIHEKALQLAKDAVQRSGLDQDDVATKTELYDDGN